MLNKVWEYLEEHIWGIIQKAFFVSVGGLALQVATHWGINLLTESNKLAYKSYENVTDIIGAFSLLVFIVSLPPFIIGWFRQKYNR